MKILKLLPFILVLSSSYVETNHQEKKMKQMLQDLRHIRHVYDLSYAPIEWKGLYYNFELDGAYEKAKKELLADPKITVRQFHQLIKRFLGSLNDYHVNAIFDSTERSSLPLDVVVSQERCFISWIDEKQFPEGRFVPTLGDELLLIDGLPAMKSIEELIKLEGRAGNRRTDEFIAATRLTLRRGRLGDETPSGKIKLTIQSTKEAMQDEFELFWDYEPETFFHPHNFVESWFKFTKKPSFNINNFFAIEPLLMVYPPFLFRSEMKPSRPLAIGGEKSFLPPLGEILWEDFYQIENEKAAPFHVYLYKLAEESEKKIGYLRIPSFLKKEGKEIIQIIKKMEEESDALVIDVTNNPGGSLLFVYELLSLLTINPIIPHKERIKLNYSLVRNYKSIKDKLIEESNELKEEIQKGKNQETLSELEHQEEMIDKLLSYFSYALEQWDSGTTQISPLYILGFDSIQPNRLVHYTKPIVVLINEGDFSCGDYFPSILQDNGRALLFGSNTAGAGGAVFFMEIPATSSGILGASYTYTLSQRKSGETLENLGVKPDVTYDITPSEIQNGYKGYVNALNETVRSLLE